MRVPHVSERVKEAPAQALRGMFAGIGQLLLVTDKLRSKKQAAEPPQPTSTAATEATAAASAAAPAPPAPAAEPEVPVAAEAAAGAPEAKATKPRPKARPKAEPSAPKAETPAAKAEAPAAKAEAPAARTKAAAAKTARAAGGAGNVRVLASEDTVAATAAAPGLPLPNYDELSVASLRARLRNLTAAQVTELVTYEKVNADRPEVVAMFERRIAKLEAEG
jgi:type IV secretory pathway VirB10-like protein